MAWTLQATQPVYTTEWVSHCTSILSWVKSGLVSCSMHYTTFQRRSSQLNSWLVQSSQPSQPITDKSKCLKRADIRITASYRYYAQKWYIIVTIILSAAITNDPGKMHGISQAHHTHGLREDNVSPVADSVHQRQTTGRVLQSITCTEVLH